VAADDPVPDRQLPVLDLQPIPSETAPSGQELLAGGVEPIHFDRRAANTTTSWAGSCSACCQAAHQSCSRARVAAGLESAATTRSWTW